MIFNMVTGVEPKALVRTGGSNHFDSDQEITGNYFTVTRSITFPNPGVYYVFSSGAYYYKNDPNYDIQPIDDTVSDAVGVTYEYFFNSNLFFTCYRMVVNTSGSVTVKQRLRENGSLHAVYYMELKVYGPSSVTVTDV